MIHSRVVLLIVLVLIILGIYLVLSHSSAGESWGSTSVVCASQSAIDARKVPYVHLTILLDDVAEPIPGGIGITESCTAEVYTRDAYGGVYVATERTDMRFKLRDFFAVWDRPLERPGYELTLMVNGILNSAGGELILKEGQDIVLHYRSPSFGKDASDLDIFSEEEERAVRNLQFQ